MIIGLDLAGVEHRDTGFCAIDADIEEVCILNSNKEIKEKVLSYNPDIVAIDAPLSFPDKGAWRQAEYELNKRRIKFFPPKGLISMEKLTMRAMELRDFFKSKGIIVIEAFPGALYDIAGIDRKKNYLELKRFIKNHGLTLSRREYTQDEIDGVAAAFIGLLFLKGDVEFIGDEQEGQIVLPKL